MSMPDTLDLPSTTSPTRQTDMETDMNNNNKTWAVTIQLTVVSTEDPLDDDAFFRALCEFTNEAGGTTFEGALLVGAKAVELEARSYTLKTEPVTEPAVDMALLLPYLPPTPMEPSAERGKGKRASRTRTAGRHPHGLTEYVYFSSDYRNASKQLAMGVHARRHGRDCVWLTQGESIKVNAQVMGHRAQREARRAAKGGE